MHRGVRDATKNPGETDSIAMGERVEPAYLANVDALIHCAYDFSLTNWKAIQQVNVVGTKLIFESAKAANVQRLVFISSMHAFDQCKTMYGRAKLLAEGDAVKQGAVVVRPGTIYDDDGEVLTGGQGGKTLPLLKHLLLRVPAVPFPHSRKRTIYTSHIDDLCNLIIETLSEKEVSKNPICAANDQALTLKGFLNKLRTRVTNRKVLFVPVPWKLFLFVLSIVEKTKVKCRVRSESILLFFDQNPKPDFNGLKQFRTRFRPF